MTEHEVALTALQLKRLGLKWYQVHDKLRRRGLVPWSANMVAMDIYTTAVNELRADVVPTPSKDLLQLFLSGGLEEISRLPRYNPEDKEDEPL